MEPTLSCRPKKTVQIGDTATALAVTGHYADGKKQPAKCVRAGMTLREIAKATGSEMKTIKKWLESKPKKGKITMKTEAGTRRSRRGSGESSIYKGPDGRWCAIISAGHRPLRS